MHSPSLLCSRKAHPIASEVASRVVLPPASPSYTSKKTNPTSPQPLARHDHHQTRPAVLPRTIPVGAKAVPVSTLVQTPLPPMLSSPPQHRTTRTPPAVKQRRNGAGGGKVLARVQTQPLVLAVQPQYSISITTEEELQQSSNSSRSLNGCGISSSVSLSEEEEVGHGFREIDLQVEDEEVRPRTVL